MEAGFMSPRIDRVDKCEVTVVAAAEDQTDDTLSEAGLTESVTLKDKLQKIYKDDFGQEVIEKLMMRIATELPADEQIKRVNGALNSSDIAKADRWSETLNAWIDAISNTTLNRAIDDVPQLRFLISDRIKKTGDSDILTRLTSQKKIEILELALNDLKVDTKGAQGLISAFSALTGKEKNKVIDDMQRCNPDELPNFLKLSAPYVDHILLDGINKENAAFIRKAYQYLEAHATGQQDKDLYGKISLFMEGWMEEAFKRK
jgi:hypothetical protein